MLKPHHAISRTQTEGCALWWYDFLKLPLFSPTLNKSLQTTSTNLATESNNNSPKKLQKSLPSHFIQVPEPPKPIVQQEESISENNNSESSSSSWWWSMSNKENWKKQPKSLTVARIALMIMYPNEVNERMTATVEEQKRNIPEQMLQIALKSSGFYFCVHQSKHQRNELFLPIPVNLYVATLELFCRRFTTSSTSPIEKNKIRVAFWKISAFLAFRVVELDAHEITRCLSVLSEVPPPTFCGWDLPIFGENSSNSGNNNNLPNSVPMTTARDVCSYLSCQARLKARRYNAMMSLHSIENNFSETSSFYEKCRETDVDCLKHTVENDLLFKQMTNKNKKKKSSQNKFEDEDDNEVTENVMAREIANGNNSCNHHHSSTSVVWSSLVIENSGNDNIFEVLEFKSTQKQNRNNNNHVVDDRVGKALLTQLVRKKPVSISEFYANQQNNNHKNVIKLFAQKESTASRLNFTSKDRRRALIKRAEELLMFQATTTTKTFSHNNNDNTKRQYEILQANSVSSSLVWSTFSTWSDIFHQLSPQARASMLNAAMENISHSLPFYAPDRQQLTLSRLAGEISTSTPGTNLLNSAIAKTAFKSLLGYKELAGKLLHSSSALIKSLNNNNNNNDNLMSSSSLAVLSPQDIIPRLALTSSISSEVLGICAVQLALSSLVLKKKKKNTENTEHSSTLLLEQRTREFIPSITLHTSSGLLSPTDGLVKVMKFLGELLILVNNNNQDRGNDSEDQSLPSHPFVKDVIRPFSRLDTSKSLRLLFNDDLEVDEDPFQKVVLQACSSLLLDVCRDITTLHQNNTNSKESATILRQKIQNNPGMPLLVSRALQQHSPTYTTTQQLILDQNMKKDDTKTNKNQGRRRRSVHMIKLALLQSSMLDSSSLYFDFADNSEKKSLKSTESETKEASMMKQQKRKALIDKLAILEGRTKVLPTSMAINNKNEIRKEPLPPKSREMIRLKLILKLLENARRNTIDIVENNNNHGQKDERGWMKLSQELERAFKDIFAECDNLLLSVNNSKPEDEAAKIKMREFICEVKIKMMNVEAEKIVKMDVSTDSTVQTKKSLAALGLI